MARPLRARPPLMEPEAAAPPAYEIRAPHEQDASPLAQLHVQVWQQAYRGLLAQEYLDAMQWRGRREERWQTWVSEFADGSPNSAGNCLFVAVHTSSGAIAGFALAGPSRDEDAVLPHELMALNVLAAHHGTGVAQQLMAATVGDRPAYLWVLRGNNRAITFYRKVGFELDGVSKDDVHLDCTDLRMVRR